MLTTLAHGAEDLHFSAFIHPVCKYLLGTYLQKEIINSLQ